MDARLAQLCELLGSSDKDTRKQAENHYVQYRATNLNQLLRSLLHMIRTQPNPVSPLAKAMACILLRQLFDPSVQGGVNAARTVIDAAVLQEMRHGLVEAVTHEPEPEFRRKLCHVLAQVAATFPPDSAWPELLQLTAQLMGASTAEHRETGYELLDKVAEYRAVMLTPFADQLPPMLLAGLQNDTSSPVRLAALKATCSVVLEMGPGGRHTLFQPLVEPLLQVVEASIKEENETAAQEAMSALARVTEEVPKFFRESLNYLGPLLAAIIDAKTGVEICVRIGAIEWAATLAEALPARFRRGEWLAGSLLPALMGVINVPPTAQGPEDAWALRPDSDAYADLEGEGEEEEMAEAALFALDRLSRALGAKAMYKRCVPLLVAALQDGRDWARRRGALLTLSMIAKGCDTALQSHLPELLPFLVTFVQDPHPRVRYACLVCLAQLCDDLPDGSDGRPFQKQYGGIVLPALVTSLTEPANQAYPRIMACTALAVSSFAVPNKCTPKVLKPQLEPLLQSLFHLLDTAALFVKEEAMTAVAVVAAVAEESFRPFFATFVPIVKMLLSEATRDSDGTMCLLGMKALEAFAMMGEAVGREAFRKDAHDILHLISGCHQTPLEAIVAGGEKGHEVAAYVMNSTARIGSALGTEFAPYLGNVLPLVLAAAARAPEFKVQGTSEAEIDAKTNPGEQSVAVEMRGGGKFEVRVNSWEIQQREVACQTLMHYVMDLGSCLGPYLKEIITVTLELITPTATPEVRICAYGMLPKLLRCTARQPAPHDSSSPSLGQVAFNEAVRRLLTGLVREVEIVEQDDSGREDSLEVLCVGLDTLSHVLEAGYSSQQRGDWTTMPLADEFVRPIMELLQRLMLGTLRRRITQQQETEVLDDEDNDLLERREEWEQSLLNSCQEALGWLLRTKGEAAVPFFQAVLDPLVVQMLAEGNSLELRLAAMCIYIDLLEFGGKLGTGVASALAPILVEFLRGEDEDARQTGAYGVGVLAQHGGEALTPALLAEVMPLLLALILPPDEEKAAAAAAAAAAEEIKWGNMDGNDEDVFDDDADGCVRDNAISSVLRLCRYRRNMFDAQQLLQRGALTWLPLRDDLREAHSCHAQFVEWAASGDPALFGAQGEHLRAVVGVLVSLMVDTRSDVERAAEARLVEDGDAEEEEDKIFEEQYVSKDTRLAIEACLAKLQVTHPAELAQVWATLPEEEQRAVQTPTTQVFNGAAHGQGANGST